MFKNVAAKIALFAFDVSTGLPKTGDAANLTAYVSKDHGAVTALADTTATELDAVNAKGWYLFDVAQAESNADCCLFSGKSVTANVVVVARPVYTLPANFTSMVINSSGAVSIITNQKKNTPLANYRFTMFDATTNNPVSGKTVTATRAIDGGTHAAGTLSAVTEIANGEYRLDLAAADRNGDVISLMLQASGCHTQTIYMVMEP
jgi:hypothetical protein